MQIEVTWTFSPAVNLFFSVFSVSIFNSHNSNCKLHLQSKYSLFLRSPSVSELAFLVSINQASCITSSHHWHSHLNPQKLRPEEVIFQEQTANPHKEVGEKIHESKFLFLFSTVGGNRIYFTASSHLMKTQGWEKICGHMERRRPKWQENQSLEFCFTQV